VDIYRPEIGKARSDCGWQFLNWLPSATGETPRYLPMRLLLGSGGFRTPERLDVLRSQMRAVFGPVRRLLFVPYAGADHDAYVRIMLEKGFDAGYELEGIHRHADQVRAVVEAEAIFVGGGNTFRLLAELYQRNLLDVIRERVRHGLPYLGISAGSNVACPTIKTTNDMPITWPPSLEALGLVPFQINPHYYSGSFFLKEGDAYLPHFGETRDDRLREFHEMNETPVLGLWEGGLLHVEGSALHLIGAPARLFRKGAPPEDVAAGARLDGLLGE
jgi:dipeptidase E